MWRNEVDRNSSEDLMAIYGRVGAALNDACNLVHNLPETERAEHMRGLGEVMGDLWFKLQLPVVREHRDLDPDGDRFQKREK